MALTEGIVDEAARALGMDPAQFRRRNLIADDAYPYTFPSGVKFEKLSHHQCLDKLLAAMDYEGLRAEQQRLRAQGVYRGIGLAAMIEVTNPSPAFYGVGGARISAQDGATLRLDPAGMVTVLVSVTEQGQGTEAVFAQVAATAVGVSMDRVRVVTGDTAVTPYGGGTWASRGAGIGGEAVLQAGKALKSNILEVAAAILSLDADLLDVRDNRVVDALTGRERMELAELGRVAYFRPDTLPMGFQSELTVTRHYTPREYGFTFTNGIQASLVEVDVQTGFVRLLKHWCVETAAPCSIRCWSMSRSAEASCRASARPCSKNACTTRPVKCATARWPSTWCRWPPRCPTSWSAMSRLPRAVQNSARRGPVKRARPVRRRP
jgi:carbon-monoxide dehydrogenase large subunit